MTRRVTQVRSALVVFLVATLAACSTVGGTGASAGPSGSGAASAIACPKSQPAALAAGQTRTVTIATDLGSMVIKVSADLSPIAASNFVALAGCGYYDSVVFHRVVPGFVIQGGDGQFGRTPALDRNRIGQGGPGYTIQDEPVTATYRRGVVAMARTSDPNSQGSQFFIVVNDGAAGALAAANTYAIIGTVTSGMEVADNIVAAAAGVEIPANPVVMTHVSVSTP